MNEFITKLSRVAALSTEGVASLASPIDVFVLKKKDKYDIDVFVIVNYGVKIPEIAWDIQENVKNTLNAEGIDCIDHINIHVQGVKISKEK